MNITPEEFEKYIKAWFDGLGYNLKNYNSELRNILSADDGDYEIDVDIVYEALGVEFHVLVECKKYSSSIKRELIQILHQKVISLGAHKGILCSTSAFQIGALEYAKKHGIACIKIMSGRMAVETKDSFSKGVSQDYCDFFGIPKVVGYLKEWSEDSIQSSIVDQKHLEYIEKILST